MQYALFPRFGICPVEVYVSPSCFPYTDHSCNGFNGPAGADCHNFLLTDPLRSKLMRHSLRPSQKLSIGHCLSFGTYSSLIGICMARITKSAAKCFPHHLILMFRQIFSPAGFIRYFSHFQMLPSTLERFQRDPPPNHNPLSQKSVPLGFY